MKRFSPSTSSLASLFVDRPTSQGLKYQLKVLKYSKKKNSRAFRQRLKALNQTYFLPYSLIYILRKTENIYS